MTELRQPFRRCTVDGHLFIPQSWTQRQCSVQCYEIAHAPKLHYQPPDHPESRGVCSCWGFEQAHVTTVPVDVTCGNCKRTKIYKAAIATT